MTKPSRSLPCVLLSAFLAACATDDFAVADAEPSADSAPDRGADVMVDGSVDAPPASLCSGGHLACDDFEDGVPNPTRWSFVKATAGNGTITASTKAKNGAAAALFSVGDAASAADVILRANLPPLTSALDCRYFLRFEIKGDVGGATLLSVAAVGDVNAPFAQYGVSITNDFADNVAVNEFTVWKDGGSAQRGVGVTPGIPPSGKWVPVSLHFDLVQHTGKYSIDGQAIWSGASNFPVQAAATIELRLGTLAPYRSWAVLYDDFVCDGS